MSSNQSLLQKADLAIADLNSNGGSLSPEQGSSFIRRLIKSPTLIRTCRVVEMGASSRKINKIGFGSRILRKATSGVALTVNGSNSTALDGRAKPTTDQIVLNTQEQIAQINLPYDTLEDNIERAMTADNAPHNTGPGGLRQTLIDLIAERAATDLEELGLLADTTYVNAGDTDDQAYLAQSDGWLKNALNNGHVYDNGNSTISKTTFKGELKALPPQFQRNKSALQHFVSVNNETEYRDTLADRGTVMGDSMVTGQAPLYAYGSPVVPAALMPENRSLFCDPMNLIFGIQRQVSMEFDKDITARVYIIVLTCRVAFAIEQADGTATSQNIAS